MGSAVRRNSRHQFSQILLPPQLICNILLEIDAIASENVETLHITSLHLILATQWKKMPYWSLSLADAEGVF
jgi:hypothetical protein